MIDEAALYYKNLDKIERVSLNLDKFKEERKAREEKSKKYDSINKYKTDIEVDFPHWELEKIERDTVLKEKRKNWYKDIRNDFYIEESINVLKDIS